MSKRSLSDQAVGRKTMEGMVEELLSEGTSGLANLCEPASRTARLCASEHSLRSSSCQRVVPFAARQLNDRLVRSMLMGLSWGRAR